MFNLQTLSNNVDHTFVQQNYIYFKYQGKK